MNYNVQLKATKRNAQQRVQAILNETYGNKKRTLKEIKNFQDDLWLFVTNDSIQPALHRARHGHRLSLLHLPRQRAFLTSGLYSSCLTSAKKSTSFHLAIINLIT